MLQKILPGFIISLHYIRHLISNKDINNPFTKKITKKIKRNLIIDITVERKELYYPLLGITVCTSILYAISLFLSVYGYDLFHLTINLCKMILPLLLALILVTSQYLLDMSKNIIKINLIFSILYLVLIVCLYFFSAILAYYLVKDLLNGITIAIYCSSVIFIYFFFHKEVKIYLLIKRI